MKEKRSKRITEKEKLIIHAATAIYAAEIVARGGDKYNSYEVSDGAIIGGARIVKTVLGELDE